MAACDRGEVAGDGGPAADAAAGAVAAHAAVAQACSAAARAAPSAVQAAASGPCPGRCVYQLLSAKSTFICLYTYISIIFLQTLVHHIFSQKL